MGKGTPRARAGDDLTPALCRAGRGLAGLTQAELAERSDLSRMSVVLFESGRRTPYPRSLEALRRALEKAGVEFIEENGGGPGVRLRKRKR